MPRQYIAIQGKCVCGTTCTGGEVTCGDLRRPPTRDSGGFLEDGVAGEDFLYCDDH